MFLTIAELIGLTGYKRRSCIVRWLTQNGFAFRIAADGYPRVLEEHVKLQLCAIAAKPRNLPRLEALKSRGE